MAIITKSVLLDEEHWNKLPPGERSAIIRNMIKNYINNEEEDLEGVNIELVNIERQKLQNEIIKLQAKKSNLDSKAYKYMQDLEARKAEELEKQKQMIEEKQKCLQCKIHLETENKQHAFPKGSVCDDCFQMADKTEVNKWMKE